MAHRKLGHEAKTQRWGYFFIAPFLIVFCIFHLWPTIYTFMLSFTDLRGLRREFSFIGFDNFRRLIGDQFFWGALRNTFLMWGFNFIPQVGIALLFAVWLSDTQLKLAGKGLFRAIVYMPNLLTAVSVAMLFRSIFGYGAPSIAPANQFLRMLGVYQATYFDGEVIREAFNFFRSVPFTRGLVSFIQWWMWYGHTLIILMAGVTSISPSLLEAAVVDGANNRQITWHITLPLLRPILLFIFVTSLIGGMQMFDVPFLLTNMRGAPGTSIQTTTMYQYETAFMGVNNFSYGAAVSVGIFIITIAMSLLIFFFMQDRSDYKKRKGGNK